ncbi:MAG: DUF4960 domain-containing protein [Fidelibacterota bacterium]
MIRVGFLSPYPLSSLPREEKGAWDWLEQSPMTGAFLPFKTVSGDSRTLDPYQVVWWHTTETIIRATPNPSRSSRFRRFTSGDLTPVISGIVQTLTTYYEKGGSLLFTLLAAPIVHHLGLEPNPPDRILSGRWKETSGMKGYPDMRGFHGFLNHPLFAPLHGGVYTWMPSRGEPFCEAVYSRKTGPEKGSVLALEWGRVTMNDNRKCVVEYRNGKGIALTIGTHLYFNPAIDEFRRHRDLFLLNLFRYLAKPPPPAPCFFPEYGPEDKAGERL